MSVPFELTHPAITIKIARVRWKPTVRIINSLLPTRDVFADVTRPEDRDALFALEGDRNERLQIEAGQIAVPKALNLATGEGASLINAPFAHARRSPGRFSAPDDRVAYLANDLATAIAETRHHQQKRLSYSSDPPHSLKMRVYHTKLDAAVHDVRGLAGTLPDIYHPDRYEPSIAFAHTLRKSAQSHGIAYTSVRQPEGQCIALFRRAYDKLVQAMHLQYEWDGETIAHVSEIRPIV